MDNHYEVIVVGAGPGGLAAACGAAALGARTLIVEQAGYPGGVATNCCCPYLMGYAAGGRQIAGGMADQLVRELDALGQARLIAEPDHVPETEPIGDRPLLNNVVTSVEGVRVGARRLLARHGVASLHYATLIGARGEGRRVTAITLACLEGQRTLTADYFVDATGDARLTELAGGAVRRYPPDEVMTKTILLRVGGVRGFRRPEVSAAFAEKVRAGRVPLGAQDEFMGLGLLNPGEVLLNFTLTTGDGLSSADLTRMDGELREQVLMTVDWYRREMPGFEGCYLLDAAGRVGVRAAQGIVGVETLTAADVDAGTPVPEPVGLTSRNYGWHYLTVCRAPWGSSQPGLRGIPWGILLAESFDNVTTAGRAVSCEARVIDTLRLMARCMVTGHAAGVTVALAARGQTDTLSVGYPAVRAALLAQGAIPE